MASVSSAPTVASAKALAHLKSIKPNDGWAIQGMAGGMKLLRRNVPVNDTAFHDLHYNGECVVGVVDMAGTRCRVLVDSNGKPINDTKTINCTTSYLEAKLSSRSTPSAANPGSELSTEEKQMMEVYAKYALMAVAGLILLKVLFSTMLIIVVLPLAYFYLLSTCPAMDTFDGKQQLKRVMRGYHLDAADPRKPKGMWEEWTVRLTATVTTELATLPGYTVEMMPLAGAVVWTSMSVPTANLQCYWVGANHQWYYVGSRELEAVARPHQD